jgi:hypothetical protein
MNNPTDHSAEPNPGDVMPDGTVYAGVSPESGIAMYVTPADVPHQITFDEAARYMAALNAHGHHDWRLPSEAELLQIYRNRDRGALKDTFTTSGSSLARWYWSGTEQGEDPSYVWGVDFTDGGFGWIRKGSVSLAARPVRVPLN